MSTPFDPDDFKSPIALYPLTHFLVGVSGEGSGVGFLGVGVTVGGFSFSGNLGKKAPPQRFILSLPMYPFQAG